MRLLRRGRRTGDFNLTHFGDDAIPPYAILSHTWGAGTEEVTFEDLKNGTGKDKPGYAKIRFCGEQARLDGLQYFWIDTCCINKANHAELSQAINSMFHWYRNATRCYVYLSDVPSPPLGTNDEFNLQSWDSDFWKSKWFTRGWTLQELLAPYSVEFFSCENKRIGDKISLKKQIQDITGVPASALQGAPLSQFSVDERILWIERRQTTVPEDKVYSLLGIFDVKIPLFYSEGATNAFQRLREVIDKREKCVQDLRLTDPRDDKKRIEGTKGGLIEDSYCWILTNSDFQRWRNDEQSRLLWIKGDPGKGKTMLLCGIINELDRSKTKTSLLSYFFCQATDSRINKATAVLRGLLYLLFEQQPSLVSHVRKKYDQTGKALFEDSNAWVAISDIFMDILQDQSLQSSYLIIDALDECDTEDLPKLLDFIVRALSASSRVKWIISSRNWPEIEDRLKLAEHKVRLDLELNAESISAAVDVFIEQKVSRLARTKGYDNRTRVAVREHLASNANDTFLWVALVCQRLEKMSRLNIVKKLKEFLPGLDSLYMRMIQYINNSDDADLCRRILAVVAIVYQPIILQELASLVEELDMPEDLELVREAISLCGSLLTIRDGTVYFVHQSAKDFLVRQASDMIFPSGIREAHYTCFSRSLLAMSRVLHRDMYSLGALGYPIERVEQPEPDPLAASRYSCIYWIDHLCDWNPSSSAEDQANLQDRGAVDSFLKQQYLYWLEALSLCNSMPKGVVLIGKLEALVQKMADASDLLELVQDARRFIMSHKLTIEKSPLQAYASALLFSPTRSLIRGLFKEEEPDWISIKPGIQEKWSSCLQTLEGHSFTVESVAFSPDSTRLASGSGDNTVKQGPGLSSDGNWIMYNSKNLLWLPLEYRPSCFAVFKNMIGIGTGHGRVWISKVESNKLTAS